MRLSLTDSMLRTGARLIFILSTCTVTLFNLIDLPPVSAACSVSGAAYQDYDNDVTRDGIEPGVGDVTVTAYQDIDGDAVEEVVGTTTTALSTDPAVLGTYTLPITSADGRVRIEFTDLPNHLQPGRFGAGRLGAGTDGETTVTFIDCAGNAATTIDLPLFSAGAYCHSQNPDIGTSCYVSNDNLDSSPGIQAFATFLSFPYDVGGAVTANGTIGAVDLGGPENVLAHPADIGTTWGLGYQASSDSFYVASFVRRHTGLGPNASGGTTTGGIYRIKNASAGTYNAADVSLFMDLNAPPYNINTGADPHPKDTPDRPSWCPDATPYDACWQVDRDTFNLVGKIGLGDIEISEDELRLYVVSLNRAVRGYSEILAIPIGLDGVAPAAGQFGRYSLRLADLPGASATCPNYDDLWPFGLATHNERLYVGLVCTAESTNNAANLRAYVYSMDQLNPGLGFRQDLTFPLNYPRRNANYNYNQSVAYTAAWQPWRSDFPAAFPATNFLRFNALAYPEPWLTGIVFDGEDMILTLRDRMGDRAGNVRNKPNETPGDTPRTFQIGAGDILRACYNPTNQSYTLENAGNCLGRPNRAAAINAGQGPGGDEFYYADQNNPVAGNNTTPITIPLDTTEVVAHDEVTIGGVVTLPGSGTVAVTAFDPLWPKAIAANDSGLFDAGIIWFDNTTGDRVQSYRLVNGQQETAPPSKPLNNQGKSNGLGDMELVCGAAPLEIGNRVWFDENRNGVQDGDLTKEFPVVGVWLTLYMDTDDDGVVDRKIAETQTDADGGYYFNETNIYYDGATYTTGLLGAAIPNVNFDDVNNNGTREPIEAIGLLPQTNYEVRIDDPRNYAIGGPLESTAGNEWYITQRYSAPVKDGNQDIRDSDGLPVSSASPSAGGVSAQLITSLGSFTQVASVNNFPMRQLTTGAYGDNNHTYDFGFVRQPVTVIPTPTPILPTPGTSSTANLSLTIEKSVDQPFAAAGSTVTWTITITNNSSNPATNVTVTDDLPPELTILPPVTATAGTVSTSGQTVSFSMASMNPGQRVEIKVTTRISGSLKPPFTINNQATLQSDNPDGGGSTSARITSSSSAKVMSAQALPATGETFFEQFRLPLVVMGVSFGLMVGLWVLGRVRVSKP